MGEERRAGAGVPPRVARPRLVRAGISVGHRAVCARGPDRAAPARQAALPALLARARGSWRPRREAPLGTAVALDQGAAPRGRHPARVAHRLGTRHAAESLARDPDRDHPRALRRAASHPAVRDPGDGARDRRPVPDPHRRELALGRERAHHHESAEHGRDGGRDRLRDDGARPEHGRRLRRAARPRLRRVLRHRCVLRGVVRVAALRSPRHQHRPAEHRLQPRRRRGLRGRGRHPPLDLDGAAHRCCDHRYRRRAHRAADAAVTRRLPRHRHARLRRDGGAGCAQRRRAAAGLQPHERPSGHQPGRLAGLRLLASRERRFARRLPGLSRLVGFRDLRPGRRRRRPHVLGRDRARPHHALLFHSPARLAARPRVDRDPRGRDGRGGDGHPAHADEDVVVRLGRLLRRRGGRLVRVVPAGRVPGHVQLQRVRLHPLHGHPRRHGQRVGSDRRRFLPRVPQHRGAGGVRRLDEREPAPLWRWPGGGQGDLRRLRGHPRRLVRDLRDHPRRRHARAAVRAVPRSASEAGVRGRRARRTARGRASADGRAAPSDGRAAQGVRRPRRRERRRLHDPPGRDREPHRAERRRQDDVLQHDHGRLQGDGGRGRVRRRGHHRPAAALRDASAASGARSRTSACFRR